MMTYVKTFTLLIILAVFLIACGEKSTPTESVSIAELIQRSEKIQLDKEWDTVQNRYARYKKKIKANPKDGMAKLELAQLFIKEARVTGEHGHYYPASLMLVEDILNDASIDPNLTFLALSTKAGILLSLHEFHSALATAEKAIALNPHNAQIHGVLVDAHVEIGNYDTAVSLADRMVNIKPDMRSYSRVSYLREIHGDIEGAKSAMHLAVKAGYPGLEETSWAKLTLGEIYNKYGDPESAEKLYQNILMERSDYPFAIASLGDLALDRGDLHTAEAKLNEAIDIIPEVGFYISLAKVYKQQQRTSELAQIKNEILEMLEDDVAHGHNMNMEYASMYLHLFEDLDKALHYIQIEYNKRPGNIDVNHLMSAIHYKLENSDLALEHKQASLRTNAIF